LISQNLIIRTALDIDFKGLGLKIHDFYIQSISVPEELQKHIDTRSGMGALGNLDQYMKYQVANAIGDAANSQGGTGDAFNTGAGLALGMLLPQMMNESMSKKTLDSLGPMDKIKKLKELLELGAITQAEFDEKKNLLLSQV
jgi:membrane protease subunit (stomatin/prohibitin family)